MAMAIQPYKLSGNKMKRFIVLLILLCSSFPLCAQVKYAAIYVPPVSGSGGKPENNDLFYKQLVAEVTYQHFKVAKTLNDADYTLAVTLSAHSGNKASDVTQYNLHIELKDNKTGKKLAEGDLEYGIAEEIKDLFPSLVYTILNTIPEEAGKYNWRNKWLYAGAGAIWTPRIYASESVSTHLASFGGGVFAEFHFLNFLSVEAGVEFASDMIKILAKAEENYPNYLLEIPVLLKYVIKLGDYFILEPYAGAQFNIPLDKTTKPPLFSLLAGFQYGVKAGPGIFYIDPRFSMDIGESVMETVPSFKDLSFQRYIIHLGIGYKYGFFTKR